MWVVQDNPRRRAEHSDQIWTGINSPYSFDFTCYQSKQLPDARPHRATGTGLRPKQNTYARFVVREAGESTSELLKLWERGCERFGLPGGPDRDIRAWFKWNTGGYQQRDPSLVQVNYQVIQTESSLVQVKNRAIRTERIEPGSSELPGVTYTWPEPGYINV
jgi:hypothetical protein